MRFYQDFVCVLKKELRMNQFYSQTYVIQDGKQSAKINSSETIYKGILSCMQ